MGTATNITMPQKNSTATNTTAPLNNSTATNSTGPQTNGTTVSQSQTNGTATNSTIPQTNITAGNSISFIQKLIEEPGIIMGFIKKFALTSMKNNPLDKKLNLRAK